MNILTIDQARHGGWSLFNYDTKQLIQYGAFDFPYEKYTFFEAISEVVNTVERLMKEHKAEAVFIEDIQLRRNKDSFKKLAQLQGALVYNFMQHEYLFDLIAPSTWQNYCNARGRTSNELKGSVKSIDLNRKPKSKMLSMTFVAEHFDVQLSNDNIADAICMGWYVVNNVEIKRR